MNLTKLEEEHENLVDNIIEHQKHVKSFFEKRERPRKFIKDDMVLLWDKRCKPKGMQHIFDSLWRVLSRIVQEN
jgi:hypothetical protein